MHQKKKRTNFSFHFIFRAHRLARRAAFAENYDDNDGAQEWKNEAAATDRSILNEKLKLTNFLVFHRKWMAEPTVGAFCFYDGKLSVQRLIDIPFFIVCYLYVAVCEPRPINPPRLRDIVCDGKKESRTGLHWRKAVVGGVCWKTSMAWMCFDRLQIPLAFLSRFWTPTTIVCRFRKSSLNFRRKKEGSFVCAACGSGWCDGSARVRLFWSITRWMPTAWIFDYMKMLF